MTAFWSRALGYRLEDPPEGFADWLTYWRHIGVPEEELTAGSGPDSLVDPAGVGPRIWFQIVPEAKTLKNRLHLDLEAGGGRTVPLAERTSRVDARVVELLALGATLMRVLSTDGMDHYGVVMADPEGNEFCVH